MAEVVGIRFKPCGKLYAFDTAGIEINPGDMVVVESEMGLSLGRVVRKSGATSGEAAGGSAEYKKVLRLATEEDIREGRANAGVEKEAFVFCRERVMARGLQMKLIRTEATLDRKRIIFYFIAEKRIDFRELVKDLAQRFRTRIEMRQIGVRDEAKMTGGLGLCGRQLCCSSFLVDFAPISIKMAKKQELVLNTGKLSGICGRLMCCLGYEYANPKTVQAGKEAGAGEELELIEEEAAPPTPGISPEISPARERPEINVPHTRKKWRTEHGPQRRAASPGAAEETLRQPSPPSGQSGHSAAAGTPEQAGQGAEAGGAEAAPNRRKRKRRWRKRGRNGGKKAESPNSDTSPEAPGTGKNG
ncbi:MAG: stage 0 sporulation family protein [Nitrospiraceae bacterium]|nr:stage 0 sporulation family protein [Nitrospiraceae bacterium]